MKLFIIIISFFLIFPVYAKVVDGQLGNASTFNAAFVSRTINTDTIGKMDLKDPDSAASGPFITNVQKIINQSTKLVNSTESLLAATAITINSLNAIEKVRVQGASAPVTVPNTLFGTAGTWPDGKIVIIMGFSDTNTVTINNADIVHGALLSDGSITLKKQNNLILEYDSTLSRWHELGRNQSLNTSNLEIKSKNDIELSPAIKTILNGNLNITAAREMRFEDSTGGEYVSLRAPGVVASNVNLFLPNTAGTLDDLLRVDGSGNLNFQKVVNANVDATAAIARLKLASGNADHVLINDVSGDMSSEAQLAKIRGGTGINSTATFPGSGIIMTTTAIEDISGKTFLDALLLTELVSTPSTPATGDKKIYCKTDDKCFQLNDDGTETELGAGGGVGGINALDDPSFEDGINNVTATVGTISSETTIFYHPISGGKALKIALSAEIADVFQTETFTEWTNTNIEVSCYIKSSSATVNLCSTTDGTDTILCVDYDGTDIWKRVVSSMVVGASGEMGWRITTDSAITDDIFVDDCVIRALRPNIVINPDVLSVRVAGSAITSKSSAWVTSVNGASTGIKDLTIPSGIFSVLPACTCTAETTSQGRCHYDVGGSTITFLRFRVDDAVGSAIDKDLSIDCQKQEADSATTQFLTQDFDWSVSAQVGGADIILGTSNVDPATGMANGSLSLISDDLGRVAIACSGTEEATIGDTTCTADESNGITTDGWVGTVWVCTNFSSRVVLTGGGNIDAAFRIVKTENDSQTVLIEGKANTHYRLSNSADVHNIPNYLCNKFPVNGKSTFRLFFEQDTTTVIGHSLIADRVSGVYNRDIHWSVIPITGVMLAKLNQDVQYSEANGDFTITGTNWTTSSAVAVPYSVLNSSGGEIWRLKLNIKGAVSIAVDSLEVTFSGITFPSVGQAVTGWQTTSATIQTDLCDTGSGGKIRILTTATASDFVFSGDTELVSKPTWATKSQ